MSPIDISVAMMAAIKIASAKPLPVETAVFMNISLREMEHQKEPSIKSDIASKIEVSIIIMFIYKCLLIEPTLEEISHFENNLLNNFEMIKFHFSTSLNPNRTRDIWDKKKRTRLWFFINLLIDSDGFHLLFDVTVELGHHAVVHFLDVL